MKRILLQTSMIALLVIAGAAFAFLFTESASLLRGVIEKAAIAAIIFASYRGLSKIYQTLRNPE